MLRYAAQTHAFRTPEEVLDGLHKVTSSACDLSVLVAGLLPLRWGDWSGLEKGRTVFLHKSAPEGWWEEWLEHSRVSSSPGLALAWLSIGPFTQSEMLTMLQPVGIDRWASDLQLKYGIRDALAWRRLAVSTMMVRTALPAMRSSMSAKPGRLVIESAPKRIVTVLADNLGSA